MNAWMRLWIGSNPDVWDYVLLPVGFALFGYRLVVVR